jgi:hypothetical protein
LPEGAEDTLGVGFEEGADEADVFGGAVFANLSCLLAEFLWHDRGGLSRKIEMNIDLRSEDNEDSFLSQGEVICVYNRIGSYAVSIITAFMIFMFIASIIGDMLNNRIKSLQDIALAVIVSGIILIPNWIGLYVFSRQFLISQQEIQIVWCCGNRRKIYRRDNLKKLQEVYPFKIKKEGKGDLSLTFNDGKTFVMSNSCKNFSRAKKILHTSQRG